MAKEIIYIDVEDDITSIIGKIKDCKEKIIALVPPKGTDVLQSDVNLRLLQRNATRADKRIVLITNDKVLTRLAAVAEIPVAKNLQSKPEIPEIPALAIESNDNDVIDGSQLSVGEHEKTAPKSASGKTKAKKKATTDDLDDINLDDDTPKKREVAPSKVKRTKVPNFDSFRKKMFIGIGVGVALTALLVWMFAFAPSAIVTIIAKATDVPVSVNVKLSNDQATSVEKNILQASTKTLPESSELSRKIVEFEATGTKQVGEKATGTIEVTRTTPTSIPVSVPAGTGFSSGNLTFVSTQSVTIGGAGIGANGIEYPSKTVPVIAVKIGSEFNLSPRSYTPSISGVKAYGSAMTGGSSKDIKIVTQEDVNKAAQQLSELSEADAKKALLASIDKNEVVIDDSYTVQKSDVASDPAIGEEAPSGRGSLTLKATYSIRTVAKSELKSFLTEKVNNEIKEEGEPQKVYDYGVDTVKLTEFTTIGGVEQVKVTTIAKVGPKIDSAEVLDEIKGKKAGEAQQILESINGVSSVEVKFSYFWVTKVPSNPDKVKIEFKIDSDKQDGAKD